MRKNRRRFATNGRRERERSRNDDDDDDDVVWASLFLQLFSPFIYFSKIFFAHKTLFSLSHLLHRYIYWNIRERKSSSSSSSWFFSTFTREYTDYIYIYINSFIRTVLSIHIRKFSGVKCCMHDFNRSF